jgi:uncharacterized protein
MEECPPGCVTCDSAFKHLSRGSLYQAKSEIAGQGLFACVPIAKGAMIIRFTGIERKLKPLTANDGYTLQLDSKTWITPRGIHRYVNHSCEPNAAFVKWTDRKQACMVSIVALKEIPKGAEILVHYGAHHDLAKGRQPCYCNAPHCVGRKEKQKPALKKKKRKL